VAIIAFGFAFVGCKDTNTHTHEWEWIITTEATNIVDGLETETCISCGKTQGTRTIPYIGNLDASFFELIDNTSYRVISDRDVDPPDEVYIPSKYNGLPVTEIGRSSDSAPGGAFSNRTNILAVHIPSSVTSIGQYAFSRCTSISNITIPENVTIIGTGAFQSTGIENIRIPSSVTTIGRGVFAATKITSIEIPANVITIEGNPFPNCQNLTSIIVNENNPNYMSEGAILYNKIKTEIVAFPSASGNVTIPSGITTIASGAFSSTSITSLEIPASVTTIGSQAFASCTSIINITIPIGVLFIGSYAFSGWTESQTIYISKYKNQTEADEAWWDVEWDGPAWRYNCEANIYYQGL
jgi:hypothetical protein